MNVTPTSPVAIKLQAATEAFDGTVELAVDIDVRDVPAEQATPGAAVISFGDETMSVRGQTSLGERGAATELRQALEGSKLIASATPFVDGPVDVNTFRLSWTLPTGEQRMVETADQADLADVLPSFGAYMAVSGLEDALGGAGSLAA